MLFPLDFLFLYVLLADYVRFKTGKSSLGLTEDAKTINLLPAYTEENKITLRLTPVQYSLASLISNVNTSLILELIGGVSALFMSNLSHFEEESSLAMTTIY